MRKIFPLIGLAATFVMLTSCSVSSKIEYTEEFAFRREGSKLTVTQCLLEDPVEIVIPEMVGKYKVVGLDGNLFYSQNSSITGSSNKYHGCETLKKVTLPDTIKSIGEFCFTKCINLEEINIPSSLTRISYSAFEGTGIRTLDLHEGITVIERNAFYKCESLDSVVLPKSLRKIDYGAFSYDTVVTYYHGNETDYKELKIYGDSPVDDELYFYSEETPSSSGKYWHYVGDVPTKW